MLNVRHAVFGPSAHHVTQWAHGGYSQGESGTWCGNISHMNKSAFNLYFSSLKYIQFSDSDPVNTYLHMSNAAALQDSFSLS